MVRNPVLSVLKLLGVNVACPPSLVNTSSSCLQAPQSTTPWGLPIIACRLVLSVHKLGIEDSGPNSSFILPVRGSGEADIMKPFGLMGTYFLSFVCHSLKAQ